MVCSGFGDGRRGDGGGGSGDVRLPGGGGPAPGPDDQLAVQQQGDLPARADLERVGRHRPVAAGAAGPGREPGGRGAAADPRVLRPGRGDDHGGRQRDRDEPGRGDRAHRHHRQVGDAGVLPGPDRRPAAGRDSHRAVRGGLLLRVHRGGPGGADHPAGRASRGGYRPVELGRPGPVHAGGGRTPGPRDHGRAPPPGRRS